MHKNDSRTRAKKNMSDPFLKEDLHGVKMPAIFNIRNIGKSHDKGSGMKITSGGFSSHIKVSVAISRETS